MKKLFVLFALCILSAGSFSFSHADEIVTLPYKTATSTGSVANFYQGLGSGFTQKVGAVQFYASSTGSSLVGVQINYCNNSNYTSCFNYSSDLSQVTVTGTKLVTVFTNSATTTLAADKYVYVVINSSSGTFKINGSGTNTYTNGILCTNAPTSATTCTGGTTDATVADAYLSLQTLSVGTLKPQVFSVITPTEFQVIPVASTTFPIAFTYLTNTAGSVGVSVEDISNSYLQLRYGSSTAVINSLTTYAPVIPLTANHAYRVRGYLVTGTTTYYGPYRSFSAGSDQFFSGQLLDITDINDSNATSTVKGRFAAFFDLSGNIGNRLPFCYAWQIRDIYAVAATTSSVYTATVFDFAGSAISTSTKGWLPSSLTVFSTSTVTYYFSPSLLSTMNALASAALWVGLMYMYYKRIFAIRL